ncbi:MAG: hypothetical protein LUG85_02945, partial [Clostridiales bacterium]|nr:hypothetical protein [Clostridiales bacterium]
QTEPGTARGQNTWVRPYGAWRHTESAPTAGYFQFVQKLKIFPKLADRINLKKRAGSVRTRR